jgi:hypothetical protein
MVQADPFLEFYSHDANDDSNASSTTTTTTTTTSSMFDDHHEHLYIYQHAKMMNPWHFRKLAACGLYDMYSQHVAGKWIVNSGSIIATPHGVEGTCLLQQVVGTRATIIRSCTS